MVKNYTVIIVVCLCFIHAKSQSVFKMGVGIGVCTSQIDGDGYAGFDKAGISGSFYLNKELKNDKWLFQLEIGYSAKGSRQIPNYEKGIPYKEIRLGYAEVPLLFRRKYKKFLFDIGCVGAGLVNHREFDDNGELNYFSEFKKYELAYLLGINYNLLWNIDLNVRFSYSIIPVRDEFLLKRGFGPIGGSYNNIIIYSLRYQFGKKEKNESEVKQ